MTEPPDPCASVELTADDGASVRFCAHGGHVLGWTPAGGVERLWFSRDTGCGPGTAIRGGVPVVWPQFAERGDGQRHGVVRDRAWEVLHAGSDDVGTGRPRAELSIRLRARNDGAEPFGFTAALHTYLRVSSTAGATVLGLEGRTAQANDGGGEVLLADGPLSVVGPLDLAVGGVADGPPGAVVLHDPVLEDLVLTADGFDSRVVWNPGPGRAPGDVHPCGEAEFVCLEPAVLDPATLQPGQTWTGTQVLRA